MGESLFVQYGLYSCMLQQLSYWAYDTQAGNKNQIRIGRLHEEKWGIPLSTGWAREIWKIAIAVDPGLISLFLLHENSCNLQRSMFRL